jgi:hypothetical protein
VHPGMKRDAQVQYRRARSLILINVVAKQSSRLERRRPKGDIMLDNVAVTHHPIPKDIAQLPRRPNLVDYAAVRADFD